MLLIISGPSGSGKGTVVSMLKYALSISVTTRPQREGEQHGREYFFCTVEQFHKKRENGELLEHAVFCGNYYGTPRAYVEEQISKGKVVVLEIDVNGALQVKQKFNDAVLVFLMPPTLEELKARLIKRATETDDVIENRLKRAKEEICLINKYDYFVINDNVEKAVSIIDSIVIAQKSRPFRNENKIKRFSGDD